MQRDPDFLEGLQTELANGRRWLDRAVVLAHATVAGLLVVAFTLLGEAAFGLFARLQSVSPWWTLVWTPAWTAAIVWLTRRWFPGVGGSGIPQVMAALAPSADEPLRTRLVSLRLSLAKIGLSSLGLLAALLAPIQTLKRLENDGDYTSRLALMEDAKVLPFGAVWDYFCETAGVPAGETWLAEVRKYEASELSKRI